MSRKANPKAATPKHPYKYEWDGIKLPFRILRVDKDWIWLSETKKIPRVVPFSMVMPAGKSSREMKARCTLANEKAGLPKNLRGYEEDYEKYIRPLMFEPFIQKVIVPALVEKFLAEKHTGTPLLKNNDDPADAVDQMARHWYGFGSWEAPFWFLGPEPGTPDDSTIYLKGCAAAWRRCGGTDLIDCIQYHRELGFPLWHSRNAPLQPTWRALIRLLFAYKGRTTDAEEIRTYQRVLWGTVEGETAVIELSSQAARSLRSERDREAHQKERIAYLRSKIREHQPKFVLMYGIGQKSHWEAIAGGCFDSDGFRTLGTTVLLMTPHPLARGLKSKDWERFGRSLANTAR